jgi:hypothetical protein
MESEMLVILVSLACVPLLALECLRWHHCQGDYHKVTRKAFWLASTSSVFWSLLGDYVSAVYPGGSWSFYLMLLASMAYIGYCARKAFAPRGAAIAWGVCLLLSIMAASVMSKGDWVTLRDEVSATGSLSRFRGGMH